MSGYTYLLVIHLNVIRLGVALTLTTFQFQSNIQNVRLHISSCDTFECDSSRGSINNISVSEQHPTCLVRYFFFFVSSLFPLRTGRTRSTRSIGWMCKSDTVFFCTLVPLVVSHTLAKIHSTSIQNCFMNRNMWLCV